MTPELKIQLKEELSSLFDAYNVQPYLDENHNIGFIHNETRETVSFELIRRDGKIVEVKVFED